MPVDGSSPSAVTVYPKRSPVLTIVLGVLAFVSFFLALGLLLDLLTGSATDRGGEATGTLLLALIATGCGYLFVKHPRHLVSPRPLLRLDEDGLECARGRVRWGDVEGIFIRASSEHESAGLGFSLRPGTQPVNPLSLPGYFDFWRGRTRLTETRLEIDLWTNKEKALKTVRRFYSGPEGPPSSEVHPVPVRAVRDRRVLIPVISLSLNRGARRARRKRPWEHVRCVGCGRKLRDTEVADEWSAWSDDVGKEHFLLCPQCTAEVGPYLDDARNARVDSCTS